MRRILLITALVLLTVSSRSQTVQMVKITDLQKIIAESKTPLVVNFWATWCKPCIEEIPYFLDEVKKHSDDGVKLLLVSLDFKEDFPNNIMKVAEKRKFTTKIVWLNETNADYFCPLIDPEWSGEIPASLFVNNQTGYRKFLPEKISKEVFQKEIMAILH